MYCWCFVRESPNEQWTVCICDCTALMVQCISLCLIVRPETEDRFCVAQPNVRTPLQMCVCDWVCSDNFTLYATVCQDDELQEESKRWRTDTNRQRKARLSSNALSIIAHLLCVRDLHTRFLYHPVLKLLFLKNVCIVYSITISASGIKVLENGFVKKKHTLLLVGCYECVCVFALLYKEYINRMYVVGALFKMTCRLKTVGEKWVGIAPEAIYLFNNFYDSIFSASVLNSTLGHICIFALIVHYK